MAWEFTADRPIYLQLIEQVQLRIVSGEYPAGSKLPAVRELAADAAVNPNTMQKALGELERVGLVRTQRTSGRFITEDTEMIDEIKKKQAREQIAAFFKSMEAIGFTRGETLRLMEQQSNEEGKETNGSDSGM